MATTFKILGQVSPSANTEATLYTVSGVTSAVVSSIVVCNRDNHAGTFNVSVSKSGGTTDVKDYIISLKERGFNLQRVTFDRWNSHDLMQQLKAYGINTELLSVSKKHYEDMSLLVTEERLNGPAINLLVEELLQLRIVRDKVDHPRKGSKDLADAVCGSIYNAISLSKKGTKEIEIHTYSSLHRDAPEQKNQNPKNLIKASPRNVMPEDLAEALDNLRII